MYGYDGKRYIDFYQNEGFALNGHRPAEVLQALKSSAARGVWAEYPSVWEGRIEKLLKRLFPFVDRVFLYSDLEKLLRDASAHMHAHISIADTPSELWEKSGEQGVSLIRWRPFAMNTEETMALEEGKSGEIFIPLIPFPGRFLPIPVCRIHGTFMPSHETLVNPVLGALMVKSIASTIRRLKDEDGQGWEEFDCPVLRRRGPYFRLRLQEEKYSRLFTEMLNEGILLPPSSCVPAIIPAEYNEGEVLPLKRALRRVYGDS